MDSVADSGAHPVPVRTIKDIIRLKQYEPQLEALKPASESLMLLL